MTTDRLRRTAAWTTAHGQAALLAVTLSGLGGGAVAHLAGAPATAKTLWSLDGVVSVVDRLRYRVTDRSGPWPPRASVA